MGCRSGYREKSVSLDIPDALRRPFSIGRLFPNRPIANDHRRKHPKNSEREERGEKDKRKQRDDMWFSLIARRYFLIFTRLRSAGYFRPICGVRIVFLIWRLVAGMGRIFTPASKPSRKWPFFVKPPNALTLSLFYANLHCYRRVSVCPNRGNPKMSNIASLTRAKSARKS